MHTRCPNCGTLYRIDEVELKKAGGQVRCYRCSEVFDAFKAAGDQPGPRAEAARPDETDQPINEESLEPDELASEFRSILRPSEPADELFSEPASTLFSESVDESTIPSLAFDDLALDDDRLPDPHDHGDLATELTTVTDEQTPDDQEADAILDLGTRKPRPAHRLLYGILALLLTFTAISQWLWLQRDTLLQQPRFHRLAVQACEWLGCELPPLRDPTRFTILERRLTTPADATSPMRLKLRARNTADFAQPLPDLQIELLDKTGKTVAQRRLHPRDYLFPAQTRDLLIPPKEVITIDLTFANPGLESSGFRLQWL